MKQRIIIIGNSGSGKTWLADQLSQKYQTPITHLDDLFWQPGGFDAKRPDTEIAAFIGQAKNHTSWIVEGVFGNLAEPFLAEADLLIWLDLPWVICEQRLLARNTLARHQNRLQTRANTQKLLAWAQCYDSRTDSTSRCAHQGLFEAFNKEKFKFVSQNALKNLLK